MTAKALATILESTDEQTPLPKGWRLVRLGDVCKFMGGMQPPAHTFKRQPSPDYVRLVQIQDFRRNDVAVYIPKDEAKRSFDETDVMIGRYGPPVFQILRGLAGAYNVALIKTIPDETQIIKDYLFHLLKLDKIQNAVIAQSERSSGQSGVPKDFLEDLLIPLPPTIEEQRRIATVLDEQMKAAEQARLAVEEQLKAAKLLPNAFLRSVFESEEAQKWQKRRLGEVCNIVARQVDPKIEKYGMLPHISSENIEGKTCRLLFVRTAKEDNMTSGKYLFNKGDVLYSKIRPYLRKVLVAEDDGICSADIYPIQVNADYVDSTYLAWILVSDEFTTYADEQSRRARMPKLNREQLFNWNIPLPPLEHQQIIVSTFAKQMQEVEGLKKTLTDQLEAIKKMPSALLRRAFAGEI